jgi:DNA-binding GntR family transcriptional regulator
MLAPVTSGGARLDGELSSFDTRSLAARAYGLILNEIVSGRLAPNQQIDIDGLAQQLGISRTPIKESLSRLAAERLVDILPRRGTFVCEFNTKRLLDLLQVRRMLETGCCTEVAEAATHADVARLRDLAEEMRRFDADAIRSDFQTLIALDQEFHDRFVTLAGNAELIRMHRQARVHMLIGRVYFLSDSLDLEQMYAEHAAIVDALAARDVRRLETAVGDHITRVRDSVAARVDGEV